MGNAFECDRCGELERGEPHLTLEQSYRGSNFAALGVSAGRVDVCKSCAVELKRWW